MLITPTLALIFEAVAVGVIMIILLIYANTVPGLKETFSTLLEDMRAGASNAEETTRIAASLLFAPGAFIAALSAFSLAIPLIEETSKLVVMWFYLGRIRRPVDGFVLGTLCGTAFALVENIGFTSAGSADWITSVAARTTTALPHIFNSGLLGWALVSAWREHRYGRLLATFIAVILVHGTWNAISLGLAMSSMSPYVADAPILVQNEIAWFAAWAVMAAGTFVGLIYNNRRMRKVAIQDS
jgi:RsiW-degrading membrane proteinase PrsW (M82 family)